MTGCEILVGYARMLSQLYFEEPDPFISVSKAFELRTGLSFTDTLKKSGKHVQNVYRGLLLYILRYQFGFGIPRLLQLTCYNHHQPIQHSMSVFQRELAINPKLRREYNDIIKMLSL
jgi:hypothetical protein